jgi:hypothetical protein
MAGRGDTANSLSEAYARGFKLNLKDQAVKAFVTLYATEVNNVAYEYKEKKQGYFTWALVEGLKGGAANEKGDVTLARLIRYLQEIIPKRIMIDLGPGKMQRPFAIVEGYKAEDLIITKLGKSPPSTNMLINPQSGRSEITGARSSADELSAPMSVKGEISGTWECHYGPGEFPFVLKLQLNGKRVTGEYIANGVSSPIINGEWTGVDFILDIVHSKSKIKLTGSLRGAGLHGGRYLNGSNNPLTWNGAKRQERK